MKCDIIIPIWNQLEYTRACIESLAGNTAYPHRLILVDNGSEAPARDYLQGLADSYKTLSGRDEPVILIRNSENLGFVKAVNQGLVASSSEYVCVLNNDTLASWRWLENLIDFAESHPDAGLLNPQCDGHGELSINEYAKILEEKNRGKYMEMNQCQGFCMLIKREVIEKIGYLDERFGIGGFDDTDYSMRAGLAGYRCISVYSSYVYHRQHVSFRAMGDRKALVAKGEEEYFKKWPRHLRVGMVSSISGATPDDKIKKLLNLNLYLARQWCWVNLWIFGDRDGMKERITAISEKIKMPLHQNIKFNFFSPKFKNTQVLIRLIERSFGTKRRKRYDLILAEDESSASLINGSYILHRTHAYLLDLGTDVENRTGELLAKARETR